MKKHFIVGLLIIIASLFSQFEITKHKAFPSLGTGVMINAERFTGNMLTNISVPYGSYQFEGKTNEKSMYYVYVDGGFKMNKMSPSDDLPLAEQPGSTNDSFAYNMGLAVNPKVKYFMRDSTFATVELPFHFISRQEHSETSLEDELMVTSDMVFSVASTFGFDNRDIEFHILSPWDKFEEGIAGYGFIKKDLLKSYTNPDTQNSDKINRQEFLFGAEGCYSYLLEDLRLLVKPTMRYEMQLSSEAYEYWWLSGSVFAAWDYSKKININGSFGFKHGNSGFGIETPLSTDDLSGDTSWFMLEAEINYYVKPELNIFFGFEGESLLFADQYYDGENEWQRNASELNVRFGATYQLNFVNEY